VTDEELQPAAAIHKSGDITKNLDNLEYPAYEPCYAASDIENWFDRLLVAVEQAINETEIEDHPWAFKVAMVELKRRDFEDIQNPEEAAKEVVQSLEADD
jgi:hypothetical protein